MPRRATTPGPNLVYARMANGTVKFFNAAKGFGFITPDDGGKDVFVPTASIASSGLSGLKPGQRLTFETVPDAKGPKAVELKLIAGEPVPEMPRKAPRPPAPSKPQLTIYMDPSSELATDALEELQEAGFEPRIVDYIANPPSREQLKALSLLLRDGDQSLVRRYDSLFLELQLDDRFISDSEYWGAIHEHPTLINGPVLVTPTRARVCRTEKAVLEFIAAMGGAVIAPAVERPKRLPESLRQLVKEAPAAEPAAMPAAIEEPVAVMEKAPAEAPKPKPSRKAQAPAKPVAKPVDKAKPPATRPAEKKPSKKVAAKPEKKPAEKKPAKAKKK